MKVEGERLEVLQHLHLMEIAAASLDDPFLSSLLSNAVPDEFMCVHLNLSFHTHPPLSPSPLNY